MNLAESIELALINPEVFSIGINTHLEKGTESWGNEYGWRVYCPSMWFTLGDRGEATLENCIFYHQLIILHELSHNLSGIRECGFGDNPPWDLFLLVKVLSHFSEETEK